MMQNYKICVINNPEWFSESPFYIAIFVPMNKYFQYILNTKKIIIQTKINLLADGKLELTF